MIREILPKRRFFLFFELCERSFNSRTSFSKLLPNWPIRVLKLVHQRFLLDAFFFSDVQRVLECGKFSALSIPHHSLRSVPVPCLLAAFVSFKAELVCRVDGKALRRILIWISHGISQNDSERKTHWRMWASPHVLNQGLAKKNIILLLPQKRTIKQFSMSALFSQTIDSTSAARGKEGKVFFF